MVKVRIFVEGGGHGNDTLKRCQSGFVVYCKKLAPAGRLLTIIPCGGRHQAFDDFKTAVGQAKNGDVCALLVDSEGPVKNGVEPALFLRGRDNWSFAGLPADHVFLMVQAMEAWFLADRTTLANFFGAGFRAEKLRGDPRNVEAILKDDLVECLTAATKDVRTGGGYHKTRRAFGLLAQIDPAKVEAGSPHAKAFHEFLRSL